VKDYGTMPDLNIIRQFYHKYIEREVLSEVDMQMLMRFFHKIVGCINLTWKEKSLKRIEFSKIATTSDEAFAML